MNKDNKKTELNDIDKKSHISDVISNYENKVTRPLEFGELCLILARFQIMLEDEPDRYTIEEFIEQEDFRRGLFS
jgi:hypothetical protein